MIEALIYLRMSYERVASFHISRSFVHLRAFYISERRTSAMSHYARHAIFENDVLYFVIDLFFNQRISYGRTLSTLIKLDTVISSTDSLLILDLLL
jgi:hypothetical protein